MPKSVEKKNQSSTEWLETKKAVIHLGQALYHAVGLVKNLIVTHDSKQAMKLVFNQMAKNDTPEENKKHADDKRAFIKKDLATTWDSLMKVNRHTLGATMALAKLGMAASLRIPTIPFKIIAPEAKAIASHKSEPDPLRKNLHPALSPLKDTYTPKAMQANKKATFFSALRSAQDPNQNLYRNPNLTQNLKNTLMPTRIQATLSAQRRNDTSEKNKDKQQSNLLRPKLF